MGANCGCLKQEKELEITIAQQDSTIHEKSIQPVKRPNWEDHFSELVAYPPITSEAIKANITY